MRTATFFSEKRKQWTSFLERERSVESKIKFIALNLLIVIGLIIISGCFLFLWCLAIGRWGYSPAGIIVTIAAISYLILAVVFFKLLEKYYKSFCLNKDKTFMQIDEKGEVISVSKGKLRTANAKTVEVSGDYMENLIESGFVHSLKVGTSISHNIKGDRCGIRMETHFMIHLFSFELISPQSLWRHVISNRNIAEGEYFSVEEYIREIVKMSFTKKDAERLMNLMEESEFATEEERLEREIEKRIPPVFFCRNQSRIQDFSLLTLHSV